MNIAGRPGSSTGTGGNGGSVVISSGSADGDNTVARSGGSITFSVGQSKGTAAGGGFIVQWTTPVGQNLATGSATGPNGGTMQVTTGAGGTAPNAATASSGGSGGSVNITSGAGGAAAVAGTGTNNGGAGGTYLVNGGAGGAATGATSGTNTGGTGAAIQFVAGTGGAANSGSGTMNGGTGGGISFRAGAGGTGTSANGNGGLIDFQTTATNGGVSVRLTIDRLGNIVPGTAALATAATDGFVYVQSCAGTPTGNPAANLTYTGRIPTIIDSTNSKFYAYIGGAWKSVTLA